MCGACRGYCALALACLAGVVLVQSNSVVCHGELQMASSGGAFSVVSTLVSTHFKPLQETLVFSHGGAVVLHGIVASILLFQALCNGDPLHV